MDCSSEEFEGIEETNKETVLVDQAVYGDSLDQGENKQGQREQAD